MGALGFRFFDCDNHYYEPTDAFTRHMDPKIGGRAVRWAQIDGRQRLLICDRINRFIPNPTFDPVAKPGCLDELFRGRNPRGVDIRSLFGELEPIHPAYRDRDARIALMDQQGMEACLLFPTLGVGVEHPMRHSVEITYASLHAFNRWLDEDWGFAFRDRIFAVPMLSLMDPKRAVDELEWVLERGARVVHLRAAPVPCADHSRSLGDPIFDPFWARVGEAGICVAFHSGESGYHEYAAAWGEKQDLEAFKTSPFSGITQGGRPVYDAMAALVVHGVFERHPKVRVCCIENGSEWVGMLIRRLEKSYGQVPFHYASDPADQFRRHVSVAPFYEDDIRALADLIGVDRVLMGSDFPHAEGLAEPGRFVDDLADFRDDDVRAIMHDNGRRLVRGESASRA